MLSKLFQKAKSAAPRRTINVGWAMEDQKASLIWDEPAPFRRSMPPPASAKSVQVCPSAIDFDAKHFVVKCPIDINLRIVLSPDKPPALQLLDGPGSTVRQKHLSNMVIVINKVEWRHPDRPILQVVTPFLFLADDPVWINQLPPFLDYADPPLPGTMISGRFPVHIWPRRLMWAFEWHDVKKPLTIRRGQPWFYVRFEGPEPTSPVRLVEAELTPEVQRYIDSISGVTNYVNRTYSLFDKAQQRRPKQLLFPRKHDG